MCTSEHKMLGTNNRDDYGLHGLLANFQGYLADPGLYRHYWRKNARFVDDH